MTFGCYSSHEEFSQLSFFSPGESRSQLSFFKLQSQVTSWRICFFYYFSSFIGVALSSYFLGLLHCY